MPRITPARVPAEVTVGDTTLGPTRLTPDQKLLIVALAEPRPLDYAPRALLDGFLVIVIYLVNRFRARLRFFPPWQQALSVFAILMNDRVILLWIISLRGDPLPALDFWLSPLVGTLVWPWLFVALDRFRHVAGQAMLEIAMPVPRRRVRGQGDNRPRVALLAQAPGGLVPVQTRHLHVHEHDVERPTLRLGGQRGQAHAQTVLHRSRYRQGGAEPQHEAKRR